MYTSFYLKKGVHSPYTLSRVISPNHKSISHALRLLCTYSEWGNTQLWILLVETVSSSGEGPSCSKRRKLKKKPGLNRFLVTHNSCLCSVIVNSTSVYIYFTTSTRACLEQDDIIYHDNNPTLTFTNINIFLASETVAPRGKKPGFPCAVFFYLDSEYSYLESCDVRYARSIFCLCSILSSILI